MTRRPKSGLDPRDHARRPARGKPAVCTTPQEVKPVMSCPSGGQTREPGSEPNREQRKRWGVAGLSPSARTRRDPVVPLLRGHLVGLGGLEPPPSSLSAITRLPPCRPAYPQVARDRHGRSNALLATSFQAVQASQTMHATHLIQGWGERRCSPGDHASPRWAWGAGPIQAPQAASQ